MFDLFSFRLDTSAVSFLMACHFFLFIIVPGNVRDLNVKINNDYSVTLTWEEPYATGGPDIEYVVTYGGKIIVTKKMTNNSTTRRGHNLYFSCKLYGFTLCSPIFLIHGMLFIEIHNLLYENTWKFLNTEKTKLYRNFTPSLT